MKDELLDYVKESIYFLLLLMYLYFQHSHFFLWKVMKMNKLRGYAGNGNVTELQRLLIKEKFSTSYINSKDEVKS
jgi:hypothetical protein